MGQGLLRQMEFFPDLPVPLEELDCIPALLLLRQAVEHRLLNMGNGVLHTAAEAVLGQHGYACLRQLHRLVRRRGDAGALQRRDLQHRAAQLLGQGPDVDGIPALFHHIHHVDGHHHGDAQLRQLGGEVEIALQISAVHDVEDGVGPLCHQILPGHHLLHGIRREGIDAGQVHDGHVLVSLQPALFFLHSDPRPVAHILIGTGQGIEQRRFAAVRIACQCNFDFHSC